jgi:hypothetical protein
MTDETAAAPTLAAPEPGLAWSIDTVEEPYPPPSWRDATGRAGLILAGAAVLACAVVGFGVGVQPHHHTAPLAPQRPAVAAPVVPPAGHGDGRADDDAVSVSYPSWPWRIQEAAPSGPAMKGVSSTIMV